MGHPKKPRKTYQTPGHPYQKERLEAELKLVGRYGLRNKREVWKTRTLLGNLRSQARSILALSGEVRAAREAALLGRAARLGILSEDSTLDDVLGLQIDDILNRRLQTLVYKKGLASTPYQARQMIVHRHIALKGKIVTTPSRLIRVDEEDFIDYAPHSKFRDPNHPMRPKGKAAELETEKEEKEKKTEEKLQKRIRKDAAKAMEETGQLVDDVEEEISMEDE